jgi:hypothetical protein
LIKSSEGNPDCHQTSEITATCPEGKNVTSGGFDRTGTEGAPPILDVYYNGPASESSWVVKVFNGDPISHTVNVFAIFTGLE